MKRNTFIKQVFGSMILAVPLAYAASCSSESSSDDTAPPQQAEDDDCLSNGATASNITANHGHSLVVSQADVAAGTEKTYSIQGSSGHNHDILISAADFSDLQANNTITVVSSTGGGHTHSVTVSCA